jgi:hypothetical protein
MIQTPQVPVQLRIFGVLILTGFSGSIFYKYDLENSSWINPLFVIFQKNVWGCAGHQHVLGLHVKCGRVHPQLLQDEFLPHFGKVVVQRLFVPYDRGPVYD